MRVAPEPYLIRLMMAGFDRIFEMGPSFRNEGVSARHQPQFELMECYRAGDRLENTMDLLEQLLGGLFGTQNFTWNERVLNFSQIPRQELRLLVQQYTGCHSVEECIQYCQYHQVWREHPDELLYWTDAFDHGVEHVLHDPVMVTQWPSSISPLAHSDDQLWSNRFELYAGGMELANGYEQERNMEIQRQRFERQALTHHQDETMGSDSNYLFAMGWGMPVLSGFGMGIDRIVQLHTNSINIRGTILFPL